MTDVVMPQMGESIVEGTLTRWLKKVGDKVERDEPLFEISTDKVDTEIPSPAAGVLSEVLVQEGNTVAINTTVGRIGDGAGASAPAAQPGQLLLLRRATPQAPAQQRIRHSLRQQRSRPASARTAAGCSGTADASSACSCSGTARRRGRGRNGSTFSARSQNGARIQHRSRPSARNRCGRPHHEAGCGSLHGVAGRANSRPSCTTAKPPSTGHLGWALSCKSRARSRRAIRPTARPSGATTGTAAASAASAR